MNLKKSYKKFITIFTFCMFVLCSVPIWGATFYVSENGTRTSGVSAQNDWSSSNCYRTISAAIQRMSGGDMVVVNDGVYTGTSNSILGMPSGTAENYTIIKARNPFEVVLDTGPNSDPDFNYNARMIGVSGSTSYVEIDGFKVRQRDSSNPEAITLMGDYIKLKRCMLRVESPMNGEMYGLAISVGASYILVQDCAFTGGFRYMVGVRCAGGSASNIIFRRCVVRCDWTTTTEPYSGFAVYGHNSSAASGPHHIYYQNCIAIDGNLINASSTYKHSPWYIFKGNHDIKLDSCITLNNGVTYYYYFRNDYSGYNMEIANSVFADNYGTTTTAYWRGSDSSSGYDRVHGCTFFGQPRGFTWSGNTSNGYIKNNLFVNLSSASIAFNGSSPSRTYNSFDSGGQQFGSNTISYNNDLEYLVRVESDSNRYGGGDGGTNVGANILRKLGADDTLYGEPGWDSLTDNDLWPWPYENEIREWFIVSNSSPSGASPSTNNTVRGFCATGQTLTRYIWEYIGNQVPEEFSTEPLPTSNQAPTAFMDIQPSTAHVNTPINFYGTGEDIDGSVVSYEWDFGDGGTSSLQNPEHIYTREGNFTVVLRVTDNDGAFGTATMTFSVTDNIIDDDITPPNPVTGVDVEIQ